MINKILIIGAIFLIGIVLFGFQKSNDKQLKQEEKSPLMKTEPKNYKIATFAGGCFWCVESDFEKVDGVIEAISGYAGGEEPNPTYKQVSAGGTGHTEAVQVRFDPDKITYKELLDVLWRHMDPTDAGGQFVDRGSQYRPAIFYHDEEQKRIAQESKAELEKSGRFTKPITTEIVPLTKFYAAEDYHQDYYIKNPKNYGYYKNACGRTRRLKEVWGESEYSCYHDYDLQVSCFNATVLNEEGEEVEAVINIKEAPEEKVGLLPTWAVALVSSIAAVLFCCMIMFCSFKCGKRGDKDEVSHKEVKDEDDSKEEE